MKLQAIKAKIFQQVGVSNTATLKQQRPDLTKNRDLRYKAEWMAIHSQLQDDLTLDDLDREEQELKQSLHRVERLLGTRVETVEKNWQVLQKSAQFENRDIILADLNI